MLNKTGINLRKVGRKSASRKESEGEARIKRELPKKEEPNPIKASLNKKPIKILAMAKRNKGKDIKNPDS